MKTINIYFFELSKIVSCCLLLTLARQSNCQLPLAVDDTQIISVPSFEEFGQKLSLEKVNPVRRHARFEHFEKDSKVDGQLLLPKSQFSQLTATESQLNPNNEEKVATLGHSRSETKKGFFNIRKQRLFMPVEELATKQFQRVMSMAEKLDILEPKLNGQVVIASSSGNRDQGSISQLLRNPASNGISGYKLRRGPYEDAYHTQIMDDYNEVKNMLGSSVKNRHGPNMNEILSEIMLREDWDIYRL